MAANETWVDCLKKAQKTCIIQDNRRKLHFTLQNGRELAEEYDLNTNELIIRKWKQKSTLGGAGSWEYEVGEQFAPKTLEMQGMTESASNPIFVRKDTSTAFQWRVRNIPYPLDTYSIICDSEQNIVIRTSNKKFYKKFCIPDMVRCGIQLNNADLSFAHANNTLIVSYKKPHSILEMEKALHAEFSKLKASREGDVDCTPS